MMQKIRREGMRWQILAMLDKARPITSHERFILDVIRGIYADATAVEVRQHLDYLADRRLIELVKQPSGAWFADLSRLGVYIVEYTIDCQPGIARPEKYWEG